MKRFIYNSKQQKNNKNNSWVASYELPPCCSCCSFVVYCCSLFISIRKCPRRDIQVGISNPNFYPKQYFPTQV